MKKLYKFLKSFCVIFVIIVISNSCKTVDCPNCSEVVRKTEPKSAEWNIELKSRQINPCDNSETMSLLTDIKPTFIPFYNPETRQCGEMPKWSGMSWSDYIAKNGYDSLKGIVRVIGLPCNNGNSPVYDIPISNISRITSTANPLLMPPSEFKLAEPCICCDRIRNGFWFFDKFEFRLFAGFRNMNDSIQYPTPIGPKSYYSKFFNTDRGGSTLVPGAEISGLLSIKSIDPSEKLQMGVHTGVWVADESQFIPVGLHFRYTFNQKPNPFENNCNTPYIYTNFGFPLDFKTKAPFIIGRYYYTLGIGYDWALSCSSDFSIDIGLRQMNLPLPMIDCCPGVPPDQRYVYRFSTLGFLRLGFTF